MATEHWLRLAMTEGIGPILIRRIVDATGSAEAACAASAAMLNSIEGIGSAKSATIRRSMSEAKVDAELEKCASLGVTLISPDDDSYPALLKEIHDPPAILYVQGTFEPRDLNSVAIVGSRKCSFYGREQAERFGALLAGAGFTVTSGGARGIDSAAHRGAMSHAQGRTIAVLGSGIDVPYPPENAALFEQIASEGRGAVVSEYPLGTPPLRDNFPRRNRIVSGLSRGVLVIEADTRSGALITARQAGDDHARTVFALPGRVDNALSDGPHQLIRDGAVLTTKLEDIIEGLGPFPDSVRAPATLFEVPPEPETAKPRAAIALTERQELILAHLDGDSVHVDALIERTALSASEVLQELTLLSLKGVVRRMDGQTFAHHRRLAVNVRYDHVSVFVVRSRPKGFEFLQLRRREGDYLGGTWQTVRGSAEPGETSVQTALRELREETGFVPTEFYSLGIVETFYIAATDTLFHSPTFVAFVEANAVVTLDAEHDAHRWIDATDAGRLFMWASETPLLREIESKIFRDGAAKPHLRVK